MKQLFYPNDPPSLKQQIKKITDLGRHVERKTEHQVKIGAYNYYWRRGTITKDPSHRFSEKGFDALMKLLTEEPRGFTLS